MSIPTISRIVAALRERGYDIHAEKHGNGSLAICHACSACEQKVGMVDMNGCAFKDIEKLEADLWQAADNLRANSKLTSSDYFMPVLGIIFLRHAANRWGDATRQIAEDKAGGKMPRRAVIDQDYIRRRALPLPESARYDWIMTQASSGKEPLPKLVINAMKAIEEKFQPLKNVLPKDYGIFEPKVLEDLMRLFNSEQIRQATGDVFGRIYEYFLAKFSIQKAHDNGEFFTPSSLVQLIVNVIEPNHGKVFDPACGSGGMFVQSSHFIEHEGGDTAKKVVFYGQEKNRDTIRIAKMNLAVHGLTGEIAEAITYYEDKHNLVGGADFVMANPPFNVDLVDAERIKTDTNRLPFGLPGVNKQKKVSNGNYLWISYFYSYLNERGRAGFVMSSQASSAGHGEKDVRQRIVETGDVDVMMSIRSNFFYTRTVPCELWFFDRGKPKERRGHVLMIDARNVFRKVNRTINDFSPEQMANLSAIVWLYRGQKERFVALVQKYLAAVGTECIAIPPALEKFETTLAAVRAKIDGDHGCDPGERLARGIDGNDRGLTQRSRVSCWRRTWPSSPRRSMPYRRRRRSRSRPPARHSTRWLSESRASSSRSTCSTSWLIAPTISSASTSPPSRKRIAKNWRMTAAAQASSSSNLTTNARRRWSNCGSLFTSIVRPSGCWIVSPRGNWPTYRDW